ncbi:fibrinogen like 1B [Chanos chanos]|uniref:Fibrinogen like 1B n=1 Tax=Chanos chanos TaxID=29144 RepID=A0A6J2WV60_CHACN|nr:fibrinogen-like protein 1 [Chanos chanos]
MLLMLFTFIAFFAAASPRLSDDVHCDLEYTALKKNIRELENKLLIGAWRLTHLRAHRHFKTPSGTQPITKPNVTDNEHETENLPKLPTTAGSIIVYDRDCSQLFDRLRPVSGFYRIKPKPSVEPFLVYCDMEDGGGWTVIQKRRNGRVDFNREWADYKDGFGNFKLRNDEFWLGNDHIHSLLGDENLMKIDLMDWNGDNTFALYENFRISDEKDKYRLHFGLYSGKAGDALSGGAGMVQQWSASHSGMQFSTKDQDNDRYLQGSCASENNGGWWFNRCHAANLNGKFYRKGEYKAKSDNGVVWATWKGFWYSLRHTTMKVRPRLFLDSLGSGAGPEE